MKTILDYVEKKGREYTQDPLFVYLRDDSQPATDRLRFVSSLSHFVMSFADLYSLVLREEPPKDRYQELVNAHTYEDGGHWKWFLADLKTLNQDPTLHFSDALRLIWSEQTAGIRLLTYRMCRLGLGVSSLEKLVLVHCIETGGKVALSSAAAAAVAAAGELKRDLLYFGTHHVDTEMQHTLEDEAVHHSLTDVELDDDARPALLSIVDESFAAFHDFARGVMQSLGVPSSPGRSS